MATQGVFIWEVVGMDLNTTSQIAVAETNLRETYPKLPVHSGNFNMHHGFPGFVNGLGFDAEILVIKPTEDDSTRAKDFTNTIEGKYLGTKVKVVDLDFTSPNLVEQIEATVNEFVSENNEPGEEVKMNNL